MLVPLTVVLLALSTTSAYGEAIGIQVYSQTYSVTVTTNYAEDFSWALGDWASHTQTSRTTTSSLQASDFISHLVSGGYQDYAMADASLFQVHVDASAQSTSGVPRDGEDRVFGASALATSVIEFSPYADSSGTISIAALVGYPIYLGSAITLVDVTTNEVVWDVGWDRFGSSTYGTPYYRSAFANGPVLIDTILSAADRYRLSMLTHVGAHGDSGKARVNVSGLRVSEAGTQALFVLGALAALGLCRRARISAQRA